MWVMTTATLNDTCSDAVCPSSASTWPAGGMPEMYATSSIDGHCQSDASESTEWTGSEGVNPRDMEYGCMSQGWSLAVESSDLG